jgi:putative transposase
MRATYIYKFYSHKRNWRLHRQINVGGEIHNHCIRLCKAYYAQYGRTLNFYLLKKHLTRLKKRPEYAHWNQLGSQAVQDIVFRIKKGYEKFFRRENKRPPTYRKIDKAKSFTLTQAGWKLVGNKLRMGKGNYKIALSRELEGKVKTLTIKRDALGDLYACFSLDIKTEPVSRTTTGKSAGFDFGLKTFLVGSDGSEIHASQPLLANLASLKKHSQELSRKAKGSGHRREAKVRLARLHRKIRHARSHWHWSLASELCLAYDAIQLETLELRGMSRLWGRKMSDLGHGNFLHILQHVASKLGTKLTFIDRFFPSSKLCSVCGVINESLTLKDRYWRCDCGTRHDRDENAATNIHRAGTGPNGVGHVRRVSARNGCLIPESHAFMRAE